jgi:outer membrane protein OmpA-like peptidoglycan-associated protein
MRLMLVSACVMISVTGCSSWITGRNHPANMLDVAPKTEFDVRYPEWGYGPLQAVPVCQQTQSYACQAVEPMNSSSFAQYLQQNNIGYQLLPGAHPMIKLDSPIHFPFALAVISPADRMRLATIANYIATSARGIEVVVEGHADDIGTIAANDVLSQKRADGVKDQLMIGGVSMGNVFTRAFGELVPACTNSTSSGKACNRRAEIFFILDDAN